MADSLCISLYLFERRRPIGGPIAIGVGRHCGVGVFAASPKRGEQRETAE
jgi:hypothetical protein